MRIWPTLLAVSGGAFVGCGGASDSFLLTEDIRDGGAMDAFSDSSFGADRRIRDDLDASENDDARDSSIDDGDADADSDAATMLTIACAATKCTVGIEECCRQTIGNTHDFSCVGSNECMGDDALGIPCDQNSDCAALGHPDRLCYVTVDLAGLATEVRCRIPAVCVSSFRRTNLCDPSDTNPCPNGGTCVPSSVSLPGDQLCL